MSALTVFKLALYLNKMCLFLFVVNIKYHYVCYIQLEILLNITIHISMFVTNILQNFIQKGKNISLFILPLYKLALTRSLHIFMYLSYVLYNFV